MRLDLKAAPKGFKCRYCGRRWRFKDKEFYDIHMATSALKESSERIRRTGAEPVEVRRRKFQS